MILSKKLKISLLAVSMVSLIQMPMIASAQLNDSESSMVISSVMMISVAVLPVVASTELTRGASDSSNGSVAEEEDDFVYLDAKDEAGNPVQLKLPKEVKDRVQINADDKIKLEDGTKGERMLYINGEAKHLFVKHADANILQQKAL